jgi:predicted dehydrogenase
MAIKNKISRRDIIKGLATVPVLGYFGFSFTRKRHIEARNANEHKQMLSELGLDFKENLRSKSLPVPKGKGDLIRIGIAGVGNRGMYLLRSLGYTDKSWISGHTDALGNPDDTLKAFNNKPDLNIEITAICDVFDLHLQRGIEISTYNRKDHLHTGKPAKGYKDYRNMLQDRNVDAIIVSTPDFWHGPVASEAIRSGKHVYCEKCMTNNVADAFELYDAVKNHKQVLQVGHQFLQNDSFIRAKQLIQRNKIGKVTLIESSSNRNSEDSAWIRHLDRNGKPKPGDPKSIDWDLYLGTCPRVPFDIERFYNWSLYWDYSTGISGQLMSHEYDAANQLMNLGIPHSVTAGGGVYFYKEKRETPDIFSAVCNFPDKDVTFLYSATLASNRDRGRLFMGHDGSLDVGNNLKLTVDRDSLQYAKYIKNKKIIPGQVFYEYRQDTGEVDARTSPTEQYYASKGLTYTVKKGIRTDVSYLHLKEWLDCIRFGGTPGCDIEKGFETTIACHMATKAYRENKRVTWDPERRRIMS